MLVDDFLRHCHLLAVPKLQNLKTELVRRTVYVNTEFGSQSHEILFNKVFTGKTILCAHHLDENGSVMHDLFGAEEYAVQPLNALTIEWLSKQK